MTKPNTKDLLAEFTTKSDLSVVRKNEKALMREIGRLQRVLRTVLDLRSTRGQVRVQAVKAHKGAGRQATAVAMASDWHVEEQVKSASVGGLNRYTPRIAAYRSRRFFAGIEYLIREANRGMFDVRNLVLVLNGDMISGYIHEELVAQNAMSPIQATLLVEELISAGLVFLRENLPDVKVHVVCQVGNHGRTTHKTWTNMAVEMSYEYLAYAHLAARHPECTWQLPESRHSVVDVYGMRIHVHHGDTVRSMGGIGGILVPLNRATVRWREKYKAHISLLGHFHQYLHTPTVVVNGSLIGYSSYADSLPSAAPEPPQQAFFLVDAKRGVCNSTPIWCGDPSEEGLIK